MKPKERAKNAEHADLMADEVFKGTINDIRARAGNGESAMQFAILEAILLVAKQQRAIHERLDAIEHAVDSIDSEVFAERHNR